MVLISSTSEHYPPVWMLHKGNAAPAPGSAMTQRHTQRGKCDTKVLGEALSPGSAVAHESRVLASPFAPSPGIAPGTALAPAPGSAPTPIPGNAPWDISASAPAPVDAQ